MMKLYVWSHGRAYTLTTTSARFGKQRGRVPLRKVVPSPFFPNAPQRPAMSPDAARQSGQQLHLHFLVSRYEKAAADGTRWRGPSLADLCLIALAAWRG